MRNFIVALAAFVVLGGLAWLLMPRDRPRQSEGTGITVVAAGVGIRSTNPRASHRRQPAVIGPADDPVRSWIGRWDGLDGAAMQIRADPAAGSARYAVTLPVGMDGAMQTVPAETVGDTLLLHRPYGDYAFQRGNGGSAADARLATKSDCLTTGFGEAYCR